MPKVDKQTVTAVGALVVAGVKVAHELWAEANKDGKITAAAKDLGTRLQQTLTVRDPITRLECQLDIVEQHAQTFREQATGEPHQAKADAWLSTVHTIRSKLPLVRVEKGRTKARHLKDLRKRTAALLTKIIDDEL